MHLKQAAEKKRNCVFLSKGAGEGRVQSLETLVSFWGCFGGLVETDGNTDFPALSVYTSVPEWICLWS